MKLPPNYVFCSLNYEAADGEYVGRAWGRGCDKSWIKTLRGGDRRPANRYATWEVELQNLGIGTMGMEQNRNRTGQELSSHLQE